MAEVSLKEIAERANVSVATVSRIMNHTGRKYSAETEARVLQIMEELHYVPNMIAKGLRTSNNMTVGIVLLDITGEFFSRIAQRIQLYLYERGYTTLILNTKRKVPYHTTRIP